ncbi:MAG: polysaccharide deacetylase family protein [Peptococcaceae bacterium]|nr:polysaccharide deacetylase family protein [Peptococcaceae bacterium]
MEISFFNIFILLFLAYTVAPTVVIRLGRVWAVSRAPAGSRRIAITFDDGPDPVYTPQILDILGRYQVKACFFVVGAKARAHPELVRQIVQAGHEIGNHGFHHRAAWLLGPGATTREIGETSRVIEELTGRNTRFCRPAWGLFNLISIWYCWLKGLKVVLWTYMSWDWIRRATPESIARKVLSRIKDGAILVFHDSDSTPGAARGGPARVVAALPVILEEIRRKGMRVVPLEEIIAGKARRATLKKCAQKLWGLIEPAIRRLAGIRDLGEGGQSIWRVALRRYRGRDWPMPDGSVLRPGDFYLELHLNNERLLSLIDENTSVERMALIAMREVRNGLPAVAGLLNSHERFRKVKALFGITLLHRGCSRLGFTAYDMKPGLFATLAGWYERWLLALFHPGGARSLKAYREKLSPKYVVMTRQELMRRYPPRHR